jgi:hypothetical protein
MIVFIGEVEQRRMRLIFGWVAPGEIAFSLLPSLHCLISVFICCPECRNVE